MNWEVSSMPFKTSFFNPTLLKKNLSRSWPLWGGVTAVGALFPLYLLLAVMSGERVYLEQVDFVNFLYSAVVYFLPAFTICYALLVAMFVWSYLHNSRSVGMMHSLAVSRDGLFVTNALSGLAMLLIPYVVVGGSLCVFAVCYGAMDVGAVALTILSVIFENLLFFGLATLCAMITGNIFAVAGYYLVLNFLAPALDFLVNSLAQEFIFGLTSEVSEFSLYFAPVAGLYNYVDANNRYNEHNEWIGASLEGFGYIMLYGGVGLLLLSASMFLYRARRSESAGDIVAFRPLRPVFRFGISVLSALTLGRLAYEVFWATLFARGDYADLVPMLVCMAITAVVGYYAASMLLEKTLRVFKSSLKGVAVVCAATVALGVLISLDLFGIEDRVPNAEDVQKAEIWGVVVINYSEAMHDIALCDRITELHRAILEDKDYIRSNDRVWTEDMAWTNIHINYTMNDGSHLERTYSLPVSQTRMEQEGTYDALIKNTVEDPAILVANVTLPEGAELTYGGLDGYNGETDSYEYWGMGLAECSKIHAALLRDAAEGNFHMDSSIYHMWEKKVLDEGWERFDYRVMLSLSYTVNGRAHAGIYVELEPAMVHTLKALVETGVVTQEIIDGWTN